jgi:acyl dehydratase
MKKELPLEEIKKLVGTEIFVSDWKKIDQDRINRFADATGDYQWIHVDTEKAAHGPFGKTIAHGFLTLSHIPFFANKGAIIPEGTKMTINYGLNKVRFLNPVPVDSNIRDRIVLSGVEESKGGRILMVTTHTIEIEGQEKPACIAESLSLAFV